MTYVELNWLVCGEDPYEDAFQVEIDSSKSISSLKTAIKNNINENVTARDLKLFKVDIPLGDNRDENVVFVCQASDHGQEMKNLKKISDYFNEQPAGTSLHVRTSRR